MDTTSNTVVSAFAFESYTVSGINSIGNGENSGNVKIALVNFWTGNAGINDRVNGQMFPTFLRVFGLFLKLLKYFLDFWILRIVIM